jgi:hypothetical protein
MSKKEKKSSIPPEVGDLRKITIQGIANGIRKLEYEDKNLLPPNEDDLLRIAEERYESSKNNGPDNHIGTGKQNQ